MIWGVIDVPATVALQNKTNSAYRHLATLPSPFHQPQLFAPHFPPTSYLFRVSDMSPLDTVFSDRWMGHFILPVMAIIRL